MTIKTDHPLFSSGDSKDEAARRAVTRARERRHQWESFVRLLTRDRTHRVQLTSGTPCTDGKTTYIRVPIELGADVKHDKTLCGERGDDLIQLCPLCAILEDVNITIYHECSHNVFGTFLEVDDAERKELLLRALELDAPDGDIDDPHTRAGKLAKRVRDNLDKPESYLGLSSLVSPWLPLLINAMEDIRVNTAMREARPGTAIMFEAQTNRVFSQGILMPDGTYMKWSDQPLNMQALIGIYCSVGDIDYASWIDPKVTEMLDDPEILDLCARAARATDALQTYLLSWPMLEALRRLGFMRHEDDPEDEPGPGEPGEPGEEGESGEPGEPSKGKGDSKGDDGDDSAKGDPANTENPGVSDDRVDDDEGAGDGDDTDDESDDDGDGAGDGEDGDADDTDGSSDDTDGSTDGSDDDLDDYGTPEIVRVGFDQFGRHEPGEGHIKPTLPQHINAEDNIRVAIVQGEHFDKPSAELRGGLKVHKHEDGEGAWAADRYYSYRGDEDTPVVSERTLAPALQHLRVIFSDNARGKHERDLKRGKVDARKLAKRVPFNDPRVFHKKHQPGRKDYFVVIGVDVSGSTAGGAIRPLKAASKAQAELLHRLGIKFAVYAHSGSGYGTVDIFEVKGPDTPWNDKTRKALDDLHAYSANLDGHTLEFYRKVAERRPETDKLIMYYTDGAMPCENYYEELEVLQANIEICKRLGISLVGIGVGNNDPEKHGLDTIRIDTEEDVHKVVTGLKTRIINR
jgi:hypothetical protein